MTSLVGFITLTSLSRVWLPVLLTSGVGSYVLTTVAPELWPIRSGVATFFFLYFVQCVCLFVYGVVIYPRFVSPLRHLPEPKNNSFFMGQIGKLMQKSPEKVMSEWVNEIPNDGLIRVRMAFNYEMILATKPQALKEILVTKNYDFEKPEVARGVLSVLLGKGILVTEGDEHKRQRKLLSPAFSFRHVKDLYPKFWAKAKECTEMMTKAINAPQLPGQEDPRYQSINKWASRCTLDIIGVAGIGQDFNAVRNPDSELNKIYTTVFSQSGRSRAVVAILNRLRRTPLRYIVPTENLVTRAADEVRRISREIVDNKKARLAKGARTDVDILSVAMESGGFSDDNLVDQLMTFLAAGHETTATALTLATYALCKYPEMQVRLREEIRSSLPPLSEDVEITATQIDHMPYLNAVCNETLRWLSPVPATGRIAVKDTTILGTFIPKGTQISLPSLAINRSTALWGDDADEFNPDRWMGPGRANTGGAESNYALMTFIHGPRSCIGKDFSRAEFACVMAAWFGRFEMRFKNPDYTFKAAGNSIVLRPEGGLDVQLTQIDGW